MPTRKRVANPKPVTAARDLFAELYLDGRAPTADEYLAINDVLKKADARTRLDPSKRKSAAKRKRSAAKRKSARRAKR